MSILKYYLRECALPGLPIPGNLLDLPPIGHKSHKNHLAVRPETWRRLENIYPLKDTVDHIIVSCANVTIRSLIALH
jgi:hypothetical protein